MAFIIFKYNGQLKQARSYKMMSQRYPGFTVVKLGFTGSSRRDSGTPEINRVGTGSSSAALCMKTTRSLHSCSCLASSAFSHSFARRTSSSTADRGLQIR